MDRRCKVLPISPSIMASLFGPGLHRYEVLENGLAPDARVVAVHYNPFTRGPIRLLIASESFDEVPEWEEWPEFDVTIRPTETPEPVIPGRDAKNRLRIYTVPRDEYHQLVAGKLGLDLTCLPADVTIVGISEHYQFIRNVVGLRLRSANFDDIGATGVISDFGRLPMVIAGTDEVQDRFKADFEARMGIESL